jgi:glycosyltransferase involved in cell wall biosynthesis
MKVLHLTNMYPNQNNCYSGIFVKNQIDSLGKKGIDYQLVCLGRNFGGYRKTISLKNEAKWADIIHAHFGHVGSLGLIWKYIEHKPIIVSYCGSDILGALNTKERFLAEVNAFLSKYVDCAIVRSAGLAKKVRTKSVEIIPCGIDTSLFQEIDKSEARKAIKLGDYTGKLILFLGQKNNRVKNFSLFKKALEYLDFEFRHLLLENIPYAEVPYYMNAADVCVLTSLYEGSPNVIKEAMACNRPIVSVGVGDVKEMLCDIDGCFVVTSDPNQIAKGIKLAVGFSRTNARKKIFDSGLDLDATADKIIKVYKEVYNHSRHEENSYSVGRTATIH